MNVLHYLETTLTSEKGWEIGCLSIGSHGNAFRLQELESPSNVQNRLYSSTNHRNGGAAQFCEVGTGVQSCSG